MNLRCLCLFAAFLRLSPGQALSVPWSSYGHDPQHTGISATAAQPLNRIKWHTPVDQVLQGTSGTLFIHYGSPMVTALQNLNDELIKIQIRTYDWLLDSALALAEGGDDQ